MILLVKSKNVDDFLTFDHECAGLYTNFKQHFNEKKELVTIIPQNKRYQMIVFSLSAKGFPWPALERLGLKDQKIQWYGNFTDHDLKKAKDYFSETSKWQQLDLFE